MTNFGFYKVRLLRLLLVLVVALPAFASSHTHKRSKSDRDIRAIGHRKIAYEVKLYSIDKEKEIGDRLSQQFENSVFILHDAAIDAYLGKLLSALADNSDAKIPVRIRVIDTAGVYAVTLPGGHQYISRGMLLEVQNEAELASALARGVAHTALRSAAAEQSRAILMQMVTVPLIFMGGPEGPEAFSRASQSLPLTMLNYRREQELDADYFGIQYAYRCRYDTATFLKFVEDTWPSDPNSPSSGQALLSPFPSTQLRLNELRKEIAEILPPRTDAIIDTHGFVQFREHLLTLPPPTMQRELLRPALRRRPSDRLVQPLLALRPGLPSAVHP